MSSVKSAFKIAIGERAVLIAIGLLSYVLIARLVSPEDVGVFSVTSAFVALFAIFRDFGSGYYIATTKDLTQEKLNTAFSFSLLIGLAIFLLLQLLAPLVGNYFGDGRVTTILRVLSFNSMILALSGCILTVMRRRFLFARVFWINTCGTFSGAVVTIALAYIGMGSMALAIGVTANYMITAFAAFMLKPNGQKLGFSLVNWREVFSFGGKNSAIGFSQQISTSLLEIAVGKYLGFSEAGLLSRAFGVVGLFNRDFSEAIRSVVVHSFSQSLREGREVNNIYGSYLINYSCFGFFYFAFVFMFSQEAIYLLSGAQWIDSAAYLKYFAFAGMIATLYQLLPTKAISEGRMNDVLKAVLWTEPGKLVIGIVVIFSWQNSAAFAASTIISTIMMFFVYWAILDRGRLPRLVDLFLSVGPGFVIAIISTGLAYLFIHFFTGGLLMKSPELRGMAAGLVALGGFIGILRIMKHPLYYAIFARLKD